MIRYYIEVLRKYAVFQGRSRRAEFWYFILANIIVSIIIQLIAGTLIFITNLGIFSLLSDIYSLAVLCPSIAVGIRRMHDIGRSGWWILVPIYDLYLWSIDSEPGENQYGPNPKGI